jgi:hypothetical protein
MTTTAATSRHRVPGRPLKSPLAVAGDYQPPEAGPAVDAAPVLAGAVLSDREATLAEFEDYGSPRSFWRPPNLKDKVSWRRRGNIRMSCGNAR